MPLPPILNGFRVFFGVVAWLGWEGGTDSLVGRISGSGSTSADFGGDGGGDSVALFDFPLIRKLLTFGFCAVGVGTFGEERGSGVGVLFRVGFCGVRLRLWL